MAEALILKETPELTLKAWQYQLNARLPKLESLIEQLMGPFGTWEPRYTALAPMTFLTVTTNNARYLQIGNFVLFFIEASGTTGGVASSQLRFTAPIPARKDFNSNTMIGAAFIGTNGGVGLNEVGFSTFVPGDRETMRVLRNLAANFGLGTTNFRVFGFYETD